MTDTLCGNCGHMPSYCPPTGGPCLAFVPSGPCDCPGWVEAKINIFKEPQAVPAAWTDGKEVFE